jgi:regulatory protein
VRVKTPSDPARGGTPSLLQRALRLLARREHSRAELRRKLAPHSADADDLERLLDELESGKLLSEARFVEVLKRSRGERFGTARIRQELKAHQVSEPLLRAAVDELRQTETTRAQAVWQRRFGAPATDLAERLRQMRFLAQRGFSAEVIRKVVPGASGGDD